MIHNDKYRNDKQMDTILLKITMARKKENEMVYILESQSIAKFTLQFHHVFPTFRFTL